MQRVSEAATNTLLRAPARTDDATAGVFATLSQAFTDAQLLVVSYHEGPDTWLADFHTQTGTRPVDIGFIDVGATTRSAAAAAPSPDRGGPPPAVTAVSDPAALTELGIQISQYLEEWAGTNQPVVVYVDSLTALVEAVDLNRAYRFLHVLAGRVTSVDGHAYYRLAPDGHDPQTAAVLADLMDDHIDLTANSSTGPTPDRC